MIDQKGNLKVKYNLVSQYKVEEANKVLMGISNNKYHFIKHYDI